jgi:nitrous oxide reductase accessory protein NosL
MLPRLVPPLLLAILLTGCGKSSETSRPNPVSTTERSQAKKTDADPATEQSTMATAFSQASEAALNAALAQLTQVLRKYSFEHQRVPKSVGEMVAAGYLKDMPQAPPGKKFAIDAKTVQVVLVNQ